MKLGVHVLPSFTRDTTDRNRTSPFAFTGNKFEFRMLGSSNSIACANIMLNASVAEELKEFADTLEGAEDFDTALHELIRSTVRDHKRIIFNGNGYDDAWIREATEKRGLLNLRTTPDCMPRILEKKNRDMLIGNGVMTEAEIHSRYEIMLENYSKTVAIEARTMADMAKKEIMPAIETCVAELAASAKDKLAVSPDMPCGYEVKRIKKLSLLLEQIDAAADELESAMVRLGMLTDVTEEANMIRDEILPRMAQLRAPADEAETLTPAKYWPFPTYGELLYGVY